MLALCAAASCDRLYDSPMEDERFNAGVGDQTAALYVDQYDKLADEGQFWHPDALAGMPAAQTATYGLSICRAPIGTTPMWRAVR